MIEIGAQFPQSGPIAWPNLDICENQRCSKNFVDHINDMTLYFAFTEKGPAVISPTAVDIQLK